MACFLETSLVADCHAHTDLKETSCTEQCLDAKLQQTSSKEGNVESDNIPPESFDVIANDGGALIHSLPPGTGVDGKYFGEYTRIVFKSRILHDQLVVVGNKILYVTAGQVVRKLGNGRDMPESNHEESNTRVIIVHLAHALEDLSTAMIFTDDTDVLSSCWQTFTTFY